MTTSQIRNSNFNIRNLRNINNNILQTHMFGVLGLLGVNNKGDEIWGGGEGGRGGERGRENRRKEGEWRKKLWFGISG